MSLRSRLLRQKIEAYEKEWILGDGDSHSDSGTDGGTDRTGYNELYGLWTVLRMKKRIMMNVEMNKQMRLSQHFTLGELCKTSVKTKDGNIPSRVSI